MINVLEKIKKIINNGQERTVKFKKNILKMVINRGLSLILSLLFVPLFLNCLDVVHYGIWVTIFTLVNWIGFFDIGIGQGLRNKLAESIAKGDFQLAKSYVSTAYVALFILFFAIIFVFLILSIFIDWSFIVNPPLGIENETNRLIIIVFCMMCVNFAIRIFNSILLAMQMPSVSSYSDLISQGACLIIIFIMSKTDYSKSLFTFGLVMTIVPSIVTFLFSYYFFRNKFKLISPSYKYFEKGKIKSILMLGGSFFIIQVTWIILTQTNNIIIANLTGPQDVAEYYIAFRYMSILLMGFTIITTPLWSATTEAYVKNDIKWIRKTVRTMIILLTFVFIIGVFMLIFSDLAFKLWIKNKIPISKLMLFLLFIYFIIQMLWSIFGSVINGIGKIRFQLIVTVIGACIHVPLAIILGRKFGSSGVVLSMLIITSTFLIWAPYQYKKLLNHTAKGIWSK